MKLGRNMSAILESVTTQIFLFSQDDKHFIPSRKEK